MKKAELELKNSELEQFALTVAHDLSGPLDTIQWTLARLKKEATKGNIDRVKEGIQHISDITKSLKQLIHEHMELSQLGRIINLPKECPFGEVAREAVARMAGAIATHGIQVDIAPDLPVIFADRSRLIEVVQNLVHNATKYLGNQPRPKIGIGVKQERQSQVFYVRDNGMGIVPEFHQRVFGLFEKLNPRSEGAGIGLAIVKRIIEEHGGRVWVESEGKGQGSTFCWTLPHQDGSSRDGP